MLADLDIRIGACKEVPANFCAENIARQQASATVLKEELKTCQEMLQRSQKSSSREMSDLLSDLEAQTRKIEYLEIEAKNTKANNDSQIAELKERHDKEVTGLQEHSEKMNKLSEQEQKSVLETVNTLESELAELRKTKSTSNIALAQVSYHLLCP